VDIEATDHKKMVHAHTAPRTCRRSGGWRVRPLRPAAPPGTASARLDQSTTNLAFSRSFRAFVTSKT
jgi:hypothetical protein